VIYKTQPSGGKGGRDTSHVFFNDADLGVEALVGLKPTEPEKGATEQGQKESWVKLDAGRDAGLANMQETPSA
jgi:hypothetical protein